MKDINEKLEAMENALESAARAFDKHSGPSSDERERDTFARDLRGVALRYARAYYTVAKEYGLLPVFSSDPMVLEREAEETELIRAQIKARFDGTERTGDLTDDELQHEWEIEEPRHAGWPGRRMIIEIRRHRAQRSALESANRVAKEARDHAGEAIALLTELTRLIGAAP